MRIKELIKTLEGQQTPVSSDFDVRGISCNSRGTGPDFIFVAIKGNIADGHAFIKDAVEKGAKAVITQGPYPDAGKFKQAQFFCVPDTRKALAELANEFYGHPCDEIKVVGVTGTNGKTTTSYLLEAMLKEVGLSPAVIGTVNYRFKNKILPSTNTTPGPIEIQSLLAQMAKDDVKYAVLEVSSHALDQGRTLGIDFHSAIFTNLTQDHLDYHHTLENYFQAKARLFKGLSPKSFAVINNDDYYGQRLKDLSDAECVSYAIDNEADVMAKNIKYNILETRFTVRTRDFETEFKTRLIGRHNIYNILACVAWGIKEGLNLSFIQSVIDRFCFVPGRLERIDFPGDFTVFVDYAHTDDALSNVLAALRQICLGRIIVVFGCGGERDKTKRPKMGKVVSELADFAVITSDNPRSEDPMDIIESIKSGISKDNYKVVADRRQAIHESLSLAHTGDIVLVAGKGHEDYQVLKDKTIHFDDREVIKECLMSMRS